MFSAGSKKGEGRVTDSEEEADILAVPHLLNAAHKRGRDVGVFGGAVKVVVSTQEQVLQ